MFGFAGETGSARNHAARGSEKFSKIEIKRQNHSLFLHSLRKDAFVGEPMKRLFSKMNDVFSRLAQCVDRGHRDAHVCQKFQAAGFEKGCTSSFASADT